MATPPSSLRIDDSFDTAFADRMARMETFNKHHYRPNTYLHKWWGRRCGSTFRLILKGLVTDEAAEDYYAPGGLAGKVILDPMLGGGTTAHESIRMGANFVGVDIDPIPVLQARATLTAVSLPALESGFSELLGELRQELGYLLQTTCPICEQALPFWHMLYALRKRCACREVWVVDSLELRQETDGVMQRFCEWCGALHRAGEHECDAGATQKRIVDRRETECSECGETYLDLSELPYYQRYAPVAVAGHCPEHKLFYKSLSEADCDLWHQAETLRDDLSFDREAFTVVAGDKSAQLIRRGIESYLDLYTTRQLVILDRAIAQIRTYDPDIRLNLALLLSTSLEFNSLLCGFKGTKKRRSGAVRHTFSHHAYSFPYTALENNLIYPRASSGTLAKLFSSRIRHAREWALAPRERLFQTGRATFVAIDGELDVGQEVETPDQLTGEGRGFLLRQHSATALDLPDHSVDAVVTDPPYFDSIQYSDLAAYFRVWLREMLQDSADWGYDHDTSAVGTREDSDSGRYRKLMTGIFRECRRVLRPDGGRLIFTFHHWRPEAWAALVSALSAADFELVNRYVVHSEHPVSVHVNNMRALTHDAILVLAPRGATPTRQWERLDTIRTGDSFDLCMDCGQLLGWALANEGISPEDMATVWEAALP